MVCVVKVTMTKQFPFGSNPRLKGPCDKLENPQLYYTKRQQIMLGISQTKNDVFVLTKGKISEAMTPKTKITTRILPLRTLNKNQLREMSKLQNKAATFYLRFRYGSAHTYILMAYAKETMAHVAWIVPAEKIQPRYYFVPKDSYSIISCFTRPRFRGLGIYPLQIQKIVTSDLPVDTFWIWTASTNRPSLMGIQKAGGVKVGEFVQKKWLWGSISQIEYTATKEIVLSDNRKFQ